MVFSNSLLRLSVLENLHGQPVSVTTIFWDTGITFARAATCSDMNLPVARNRGSAQAFTIKEQSGRFTCGSSLDVTIKKWMAVDGTII